MGDSGVEVWEGLPGLLLRGFLEGRADVGFGGRGDADEEGAGADGGDDAGGAVRDEDQAHVVAVFLHCASEGGLGVAREGVGFVDDDDFEALFGVHVDLLGLRDFFEEFLDDDAVVVADIAGGDFEVVDGGDDVEFEFAGRGG